MAFFCLIAACMVPLFYTCQYDFRVQAEESRTEYEIPEVQAGMQVYLAQQTKYLNSQIDTGNAVKASSKVQLSDSDYDCLLKIVESEAGICDQKGKILVANVVLNRMSSSHFPDTVKEVVYQKNQFSPVENGSIDQVSVTEETRQAVSLALSGTDYSQGALFFAARRLAGEDNMKWFDRSLHYLFEHDGHEFYTLKQNAEQ